MQGETLMKDNSDKLILFLGTLILLVFSYLLCGGFTYLIFLCFDLTFTWKISTGVWLVLFLLKICFMVYKHE